MTTLDQRPTHRVAFRVAPGLEHPSLKGFEVLARLLPLASIVDCEPDILETSPDSLERDYVVHIQLSAATDPRKLERALSGDGELRAVRVEDSASDEQPERRRGEIPVAAERLEELELAASELVAGLSRLGVFLGKMKAGAGDDRQAGHAGHAGTLKDAWKLQQSLAPLAAKLRDTARQLRLVPAGTLLGRLHRALRDAASRAGREAGFVVDGEETEVDQDVLEALREPLVHLIRNAVGHGIEPPEERLAAGKPRGGTVRVSSYVAGENAVFEVRDDGRGLDRGAIGAKAVELGLCAAGELETLSDPEVFNFIYAPGFSTAGALNSISGRGVGMDVVKSRVLQLHGTIETESRAGRGSTFTIRVPVSASLIRALVVVAGGRRLAIPASSIRSVGFADRWRAEHGERSFVSLAMALGWGMPPCHRVVEVGVAERRIGFGVESCLDDEELAVKPLGRFLGSIPVISGAAISGTGHPLLVVDTAELVSNLRI